MTYLKANDKLNSSTNNLHLDEMSSCLGVVTESRRIGERRSTRVNEYGLGMMTGSE
ncbi:hypothetical protein LCB40_15470 [Lactobacillus corticis]|uniref:Uncharacterized protein n=1 Tax=Lactobacillus corticis TaxID=2201249 RepID=A0A916QJT1_9LACO|nr:hypothetical protein LCB40_15470 [Lactobacillus corticis]